MKIEANLREALGKGASRRLRHAEKVPAIIYGKNEAALSVTLEHSVIINQMEKAEFYQEITLVVNGKEIKVKPQDIQRHAFKPKVMHIDFVRI
ncbi:MAG: 50S ribosomal protein L25 [Enterovibrio sp.]